MPLNDCNSIVLSQHDAVSHAHGNTTSKSSKLQSTETGSSFVQSTSCELSLWPLFIDIRRTCSHYSMAVLLTWPF